MDNKVAYGKPMTSTLPYYRDKGNDEHYEDISFFLSVLINNILTAFLILAGGWLFCITTFFVIVASGYFAGLYFYVAYRLYSEYSLLLYAPLPLEVTSIVLLGNVAVSICEKNYSKLIHSSKGGVSRDFVRSNLKKTIIGIILLVIGSFIEYILPFY